MAAEEELTQVVAAAVVGVVMVTWQAVAEMALWQAS